MRKGFLVDFWALLGLVIVLLVFWLLFTVVKDRILKEPVAAVKVAVEKNKYDAFWILVLKKQINNHEILADLLSKIAKMYFIDKRKIEDLETTDPVSELRIEMRDISAKAGFKEFAHMYYVWKSRWIILITPEIAPENKERKPMLFITAESMHDIDITPDIPYHLHFTSPVVVPVLGPNFGGRYNVSLGYRAEHE